MIPTPMRPTRRHGLGAVDRRTGGAAVITRRRERRREAAERSEALLARHPHGTVHVARDNASTHGNGEIEAVPRRGAAGRLVLLRPSTYSPWLNPAEMLRRHYRREVTHRGLFGSLDALLEATREFFERMDRPPGTHPPHHRRAPHATCADAFSTRARNSGP